MRILLFTAVLTLLSGPACQRNDSSIADASRDLPLQLPSAPSVLASPGVSEAPPAPPRGTGGFPPPGSWLVAEGFLFLRPWPFGEATLLVAEPRIDGAFLSDGVGSPSAPELGPTPIFRLAAGSCVAAPEFQTGFPVLGGINLDAEPDHAFGKAPPPSPRVIVKNPHPGRRVLVGIGESQGGWAVFTRFPEYRKWEAVSDLYRWSRHSWIREASSGARGLDWPYVTDWSGGILVAERDRRPAGASLSWRLRVLKGKSPAPKLDTREDTRACPATRITAMYGFESGELLTTGATCDHAFLIERWASSTQPAVAQTVREIITDVAGLGYEIEVVSPSLVRVRGAGASMTNELRFDEGWSVRATTIALKTDALQARLRALGTAFAPANRYFVRDMTLIAGVLDAAPTPHAVLVADRSVKDFCAFRRP